MKIVTLQISRCDSELIYLRSEAVTVVSMKNSIFWDGLPHSLVEV
jgi:hypothetical protein